MKKLFLSIGALGATVIPVAATISCQWEKSNKDNTNYSQRFFAYNENPNAVPYHPWGFNFNVFERKIENDGIHDGDSYFPSFASLSSFKSSCEEVWGKMYGSNSNEFKLAKTAIDASNGEIRLFGVDTPELSYPVGTSWIETTGIEREWADKATAWVKSVLTAPNIFITPTKLEDHGRVVANIKYDLVGSNVQVQSKDLGIELVRAGLGRVAYVEGSYLNGINPLNKNYILALIKAQDEARANGKGFWSLDNNQIWAHTISDTHDGSVVFPKGTHAVSSEEFLKRNWN